MNSGALNILVVDDEAPVTTSIKVALSGAGHFVDVLHDAAEALMRLAEFPNHYHILITDHLMSKISGMQFLLQLPVNAFKGKIIVLSAYLTPQLEKDFQRLGAERIMRKPFDADELRTAVEELRK
jgi:DNA-binding response OmpR family regulator